jgi:hypothetical protein
VSDIDEDYDNDGLSNGVEIQLGYNLEEADSDHDGVADIDEDADGDGLSNGAEVKSGYNPADSGNHDDGEVDDDSTIPSETTTQQPQQTTPAQ